jgi:predicted GNAT family N-acyltransferase
MLRYLKVYPIFSSYSVVVRWQAASMTREPGMSCIHVLFGQHGKQFLWLKINFVPFRVTLKSPSMTVPRYITQLVTWKIAEPQLRAIRTEVYIHEQNISEELEWDGEDAHAIHALTTDSAGNPIGTGRLLLHGELAHIGRMAVLSAWRGKGVGTSVLQCLLDEAKQRGAGSAFLNAQTYATPFYERFNFAREGAEFLEANIPHYRMTRSLV